MIGGSLDKTAKIWNLKTSKNLGTLTGHLDYVNVVNCANGYQRCYTGSSDRSIKEWDLENFKLLKTFNGASGVNSLCLSNNDSLIYSGHSDGSIKIWSTMSNDKPENILDIHENKVISIQQLKNDFHILTSSL